MATLHEYGSTQVNLPPHLAARVRNYQQTIPGDHLGPGGLESQPHITVKYGLRDGVTGDAVARVLGGEAPVSATFGLSDTFPAGDDGVPLFATVESPGLHRLNALVKAQLPSADTFPTYTPHVTLAYLRPEVASRYAGARNALTGQSATFDTVTFGDTVRNQTDVLLGGNPAMTNHDELLRADIAKTDDERQIVFGWASVSVTKDGTLLVDRQDDVIFPQDLEDAAYDFVLHSRSADLMHDEVTRGTLVESVVFTAEKLEKMGLAFTDVAKADQSTCMWWTGFHLDADTFAKVRKGQFKAFSIGGSASRVPITT